MGVDSFVTSSDYKERTRENQSKWTEKENDFISKMDVAEYVPVRKCRVGSIVRSRTSYEKVEDNDMEK